MTEFVEYLHETFGLLGPITTRRMFGGYGVYHDGVMFGLVAKDTLYLRADAENTRHFEEAGLNRYGYRKGDKVTTLPYYLAPAEILEDREQAAVWARRSIDAALRARNRRS